MHLADGRYVSIEQAELRTSTGSGSGWYHRNLVQMRVGLRLLLSATKLTPEELQRVWRRLRAQSAMTWWLLIGRRREFFH